MVEYYVMDGETRYDFADFDSARAKALEVGANAVLHLAGGTINVGTSNLTLGGGVTTVMDGITIREILGGPQKNGTVAFVDLTLSDCTISSFVIATGVADNDDYAGIVVSGTTTVTVNSGNYSLFGGVQIGTTHDIVLNINGGTFARSVGAFVSRNGSTVDGAFTINMTGGRVNTFCFASGYQNQSGTINGGIHFNMSDGIVGTSFNPSTGASTINGGMWINLTGGTFLNGGIAVDKNHVFGSGTNAGNVVNGGVHVTIDGFVSGDGCWIYGANKGTVNGDVEMTLLSGHVRMLTGGGAQSDQAYDVTITVNGGIVDYITGACYQNQKLTGDVEINITAGTLTNTFNGAGNKIGSNLTGSVVTNISGADTLIAPTDDFTISGSGWQEGDATMNISGGTIAGMLSGLGKRTDCGMDGNIYLNITGGIFTNTQANILGGGKVGGDNGGVGGNVEINISGGSFYSNIFLAGGSTTVLGDCTMEIGAVGINGSVFGGSYAGGYVDGNVSITVDGTVIGGLLSGSGYDPDTFELGEGSTSTLTVGAAGVTVAGAVSDFDSIAIAAGATIAAGSVTAAAITATASETQGLYTLATGFAAQDCVIIINNAAGATLGSVTLSDSVTSGTFSAGGLDYVVAAADNALTLQVGDAPVPPTPTSTVAEVILTITDPNHDYFGATGGWKVQNDQTVAWQDLTTLGEGYAYLGLGVTAASKAMPDIYVYNADAKYVAAYVTDDTGAITGFESIFSGEAALMQVGIADFNADGVSDLLLRTADGFVGYYANSTFAEVQGLGTEWTVAALGDVDGNGRADVIIAHEAGYVGAYLIGNDGSISWADLGNLDASTAIVGAGDVNGDGTDDVIVQVGANYYGAWTCGQGAVTGFFGIGEFDASVQDIADYNADGKDDLLFRTASGVVGAALITGADTTTWAEYGALGAEWSTKGVGIL